MKDVDKSKECKVKRKIKQMLAGFMVLVLSMTSVTIAEATSIGEAEDNIEKLEEQEQAAEAQQDEFIQELEEVALDLEDTEKKINETYEEIQETEVELALAEIDEANQYESMKKRIQYSYESEGTDFLAVFLDSKNIGEFLNTLEYASQIIQFDNLLLEEYQATIQKIENKQIELEEQSEKLKTLQDELIEKQAEVEELLAQVESELSVISSEISAAKDTLQRLIEAAELERQRQEALAAAQGDASSGGTAGESSNESAGSSGFVHPIPGYSRISSTFGYRDAPLAGASTNHKGVDYAAPTGTPIYAAMGGVVTVATYSSSAGYWITVDHGNGFATIYMHNSANYVSVGETVSQGQNIAACGTTGNSTGPHLHFQIMKNNVPVDPQLYI